MIISQLTLAVFTGKWLTSQYAEEKAYLRDKVDHIYSKTANELVDSMIEVNFSVPFKASMASNQFKPVTSLSIGTLFADTTAPLDDKLFQDKPVLPDARPHPKTISTLIYSKNNRAATAGNGMAVEHISVLDSLTPAAEMGLRQFAMKLKTPSGISIFAIRDSTRMLDLFRKNLRKELPLTGGWADHGAPATGFIIPTDFTTNLHVTGYHTFLLRKISPQIGFSALLLLLCGCAFTLSYITVSRQMRLSAQKDSFISNMSHELKTPVSTVKIAIEALRDYNALEDPVKTRDYLQMAGWEIDRLETLISNVLNSMQLKEGKISIQHNPVDVGQLLPDIHNSIQPLLRKHNKTVELVINETGLSVMGDRIHLQGALYNIIDNAIKYGGPDIRIAAYNTGNTVHINISDNGPGIPPEYRQKIFEKFFRIPSGNVHDVKGYGLGLNYTRYVIRAHGGQIHQQNNQDGGAAFIIALPI